MPFTTPRMNFAKKNSQVFQKLSTKNTLEILELLLYIEWSQTFQKYLKQQNIFQLSQFESFYCWTVMITYRVSQKYLTRNSSFSLKCQFLLHQLSIGATRQSQLLKQNHANLETDKLSESTSLWQKLKQQPRFNFESLQFSKLNGKVFFCSTFKHCTFTASQNRK